MNKALLVIGILISPLVFAQAMSKKDFAYGVDVEAKANSYYEVGLTKEVYEGIQNPHLHDLRVYGPDGEPVPYLIKRQKQARSQSELSLVQTFFPVKAPAELAHSDNVHVRINRDGRGMSIDYQSVPGAQSEKNDSAYFYVIDLGEKPDKYIQSLQLLWNEKSVEQSRITVSTSKDLNHWRYAGQGNLLSLSYNGNTLLHDTIDLTHYDRYLKVTSDKETEFRLKEVKTKSRHEEAISQDPIWTEVTGTRRADNEYYYLTPGNFPVDYLQIAPTAYNKVHNVWMRSGSNDKEFSHTHYRGQTYLLKVGEDEVRSDTISVFGTTDRHWLLTVLDKDQTIAPMMLVKIGWYPHVVHFVSSKPGIYTIAYGSSSIDHQGTTLPSALLKDQYTPIRIESGHPGLIGGAEQLIPPPDRSRYAKWMLWIILSSTLLVVGYMALRLFRHMNESDTP